MIQGTGEAFCAGLSLALFEQVFFRTVSESEARSILTHLAHPKLSEDDA